MRGKEGGSEVMSPFIRRSRCVGEAFVSLNHL